MLLLYVKVNPVADDQGAEPGVVLVHCGRCLRLRRLPWLSGHSPARTQGRVINPGLRIRLIFNESGPRLGKTLIWIIPT